MRPAPGDVLQCAAPLLAALAGARIGARALAAHRQALAMAQAAVAAEVHQPLDAHRHFAAQVALDGERADVRRATGPARESVRSLIFASPERPPRRRSPARRAADAVDRRQTRSRHAGELRDVDASDTCHVAIPRMIPAARAAKRRVTVRPGARGSAATTVRAQPHPWRCLWRGSGADDAHHALAADDLAVAADLLHRSHTFMPSPLNRFSAPRWRAFENVAAADTCYLSSDTLITSPGI